MVEPVEKQDEVETQKEKQGLSLNVRGGDVGDLFQVLCLEFKKS